MSALCIEIDDKTPLLNPDFQHPHFTERTHINVDLAKDVNPYWISLMDNNNMRIDRVELFYGPEGFPYVMGIHIDHAYGDRAKLNWIFGGEGSTMHWYKALKPASKEVLATPVHSNYTLYEPDEVKLLHTTKVITPSIVQAGIPHNIVNPGRERWCYSMVIIDNDTGEQPTFGRLKKVFGK